MNKIVLIIIITVVMLSLIAEDCYASHISHSGSVEVDGSIKASQPTDEGRSTQSVTGTTSNHFNIEMRPNMRPGKGPILDKDSQQESFQALTDRDVDIKIYTTKRVISSTNLTKEQKSAMLRLSDLYLLVSTSNNEFVHIHYFNTSNKPSIVDVFTNLNMDNDKLPDYKIPEMWFSLF